MVKTLVTDIYNNEPKLIFINNDRKNNLYDFIEDKEQWEKFINEKYEVDNISIKGYIIYKNIEN